jgi:hypothetical protein
MWKKARDEGATFEKRCIVGPVARDDGGGRERPVDPDI